MSDAFSSIRVVSYCLSVSSVFGRHVQGDDVSVGGLHSDAQGVLAVLIPVILSGSSLQE